MDAKMGTVRKIVLVVVVVALLACSFAATVAADKPTDKADKADKTSEKGGNRDNGVPDSDGRGMDRGEEEEDGPAEGGDWDNGSGNEPDGDCEDDNNGRGPKCNPQPTDIPTEEPTPTDEPTATPTDGPTSTPTPAPTKTPEPTCHICFSGEGAVEIGPLGWIATMDESSVWTEGRKLACYDFKRGQRFDVLDWTEALGHRGPAIEVTVLSCPVDVVPVVGPWNVPGLVVRKIITFLPVVIMAK